MQHFVKYKKVKGIHGIDFGVYFRRDRMFQENELNKTITKLKEELDDLELAIIDKELYLEMQQSEQCRHFRCQFPCVGTSERTNMRISFPLQRSYSDNLLAERIRQTNRKKHNLSSDRFRSIS